MKLRYWTVRAVPSANSITTIGIGVIVEDMATGEIAARFKKDSSQLAYMESQQSIMRLADELEQHVVHLACQHHRHSIGHELSVNGYLASLMDYWNNMLIIDEPKQVDSTSIEQATQLLFVTLIGDEHYLEHSQLEIQARDMVKATYRRHKQLEKNMYLPASVDVDGFEIPLNLVIIKNANVFELNSVISFESLHPQETISMVEAWTLKIDKLRTKGGRLHTDNHVISLAKDTDITAVYWPPKTPRQHEVFDSVTVPWAGLGITDIPLAETDEHAGELAKRLDQ